MRIMSYLPILLICKEMFYKRSFIIHENKLICLLLFISCLFDILLFWHSDNIVEFLSSKLIGDRIYLTEEDLMNYLSNPSIKFYLFNEKNDAQLKEKCKEFIDNNINNRRNHFDQVGFIAVFKDVLLQDDKLKNMIYESKKFFLELKITIIVNLIQIIFLIMFVVNFCILLHSVKVKFGLLRILTTFVSILFIVSVMIVCFKIIFKTEKGKYTDKTKSLATNN